MLRYRVTNQTIRMICCGLSIGAGHAQSSCALNANKPSYEMKLMLCQSMTAGGVGCMIVGRRSTPAAVVT
jgi:hypothetical protein